MINSLLSSFGVQLKKISAMDEERRHYITIINGALQIFNIHKKYEGQTLNNDLSGMVFSKDRAMQLHALLTSYTKTVQGNCPLLVLYKGSNEHSRCSYNELKNEFSQFPITFVEEYHFKKQVIKWLQKETADRIFFLTDDAVFLDTFDLTDATFFNPLDEIFSLTKGKDLLYCFTMNVRQELPMFRTLAMSGKKFNSWIWANELSSPDWSYPLSVDGCFYLREEMLAIAENIIFHNPNTLEANMQLYKSFFLKRKGVCYDKVKLINVPCNLVQSSFNNRSTGHFDAEELLKMWSEGKRINVDEFYGLSAFDAEHAKYNFYKQGVV